MCASRCLFCAAWMPLIRSCREENLCKKGKCLCGSADIALARKKCPCERHGHQSLYLVCQGLLSGQRSFPTVQDLLRQVL